MFWIWLPSKDYYLTHSKNKQAKPRPFDTRDFVKSTMVFCILPPSFLSYSAVSMWARVEAGITWFVNTY